MEGAAKFPFNNWREKHKYRERISGAYGYTIIGSCLGVLQVGKNKSADARAVGLNSVGVHAENSRRFSQFLAFFGFSALQIIAFERYTQSQVLPKNHT
jgi:hypothetical protein